MKEMEEEGRAGGGRREENTIDGRGTWSFRVNRVSC